MIKRSTAAVVFAAMAGIVMAPAAAAQEAPMIAVKRLSLETALTIARGAVAVCRKQGIQIGVSVVDRDGTLQVQLRDTIAAPITLSISRRKAYTAVNFNAATSALGSRADTPIGRIDGLVMSAGGIPIQVGGSLVGAVGVSGAPSGRTDEECARGGIDTVIDDLEMAM